jgi:hypothetical protein
MVVAGVRSRGLPAMSRKELRARRNAERLGVDVTASDDEHEHETPPPQPANDWSTPWWEPGALTPVD